MTVRRPPQLEPLGDRILPSAAVPTAPHPLAGRGEGAYAADAVQSGAGTAYRLDGAADLKGLGPATITGVVNAVGFIQQGHAGGTLTFATARGSVTVELAGPEQPAFAPLPHAFAYRVVGGGGAFARLADHGVLYLALGPAAGGAGQGPHGSFALALDEP